MAVTGPSYAVRFPEATDDPAEARRYLENRAVQALIDGWSASREVEEPEWGLQALARSPHGVPHQTFYVYARFRGQGRVAPALRARGLPVVTTPDCRLEPFLLKHALPHAVICRFTEEPEYRAVAAFYGDRRAARSQV